MQEVKKLWRLFLDVQDFLQMQDWILCSKTILLHECTTLKLDIYKYRSNEVTGWQRPKIRAWCWPGHHTYGLAITVATYTCHGNRRHGGESLRNWQNIWCYDDPIARQLVNHHLLVGGGKMLRDKLYLLYRVLPIYYTKPITSHKTLFCFRAVFSLLNRQVDNVVYSTQTENKTE